MTHSPRPRRLGRASRPAATLVAVLAVLTCLSLSACDDGDADSKGSEKKSGTTGATDTSPTPGASDTAAPEGESTASNPAISSALALDSDGICALLTADEVGAAVGQSIDVEPTTFNTGDMSATCSYLVDNGSGLDDVATFGFESIAWNLLEIST